jgi:hypothetical protein
MRSSKEHGDEHLREVAIGCVNRSDCDFEIYRGVVSEVTLIAFGMEVVT